MPNCNLIVDSCSDIPVEFIQKEGITLLEFRDDLFQTSSAKEFYDRMRNGAFPTTAQLPLKELIDTFTEVAKSGVPTVYLAFSSGLSKTFEVAQMAAEQVQAKYPDMELYRVDSLTCAAGESLFLFEGIRQWESGLSAKELADWAMEARWKVNKYKVLVAKIGKGAVSGAGTKAYKSKVKLAAKAAKG